MTNFVLCLSISLQLLAAFLAARQLRLSGTPLAWLCISAALVLMAIRCVVTLFDAIIGNASRNPDLTPELVALVISVLMVVGVVFMARHFREILRTNERLEQEITERNKAEDALRKTKEDLELKVTKRTSELRKSNERLQLELTERENAEEALQKAHDELRERVKELNCLYGISELLENRKVSLDQSLQGIVDIIPPAWQYPEGTCARIILNGGAFATKNYREPVSKQSAHIIVHGAISGTVEVGYLEERREIDEGPFLKEERLLINAIAERVGKVVERIRTTEALQKEKEFTETALDSQRDTFFLFETATGRAIRWNRAFKDITGYTDEEIAAMPAPDSYYSPEDLERARICMQKVLETGTCTIELELICKDGQKILTEYDASVVEDVDRAPKYLLAIGRDIRDRKKAERDRERLIAQLEQALADVKRLSGFLPICASCKKIRDDKGYWQQIEAYIRDHSEAEFSHGICPECAKTLYPELYREKPT